MTAEGIAVDMSLQQDNAAEDLVSGDNQEGISAFGVSDRRTDDILLSHARPNPDILSNQEEPAVETQAPQQDVPIWKSENAELINEGRGGFESYVIWKYKPGSEGVKKFPQFNAYDPLPHHYYKTTSEYEEARQKYFNGGDPDQVINRFISNPRGETDEPSVIQFQPSIEIVHENSEEKLPEAA